MSGPSCTARQGSELKKHLSSCAKPSGATHGGSNPFPMRKQMPFGQLLPAASLTAGTRWGAVEISSQGAPP